MLRKSVFSVKIIAMVFPLLIAGILLAFPKPTTGYSSDNSTLDVNIQQLAEITVNPPSLSWALPPCRESTPKLLDIRNTGSLNVSDIHAYVSTLDNETIRPYGQDNSSWYSATSLITIKNETNSSIYFAGRLEWNWTEDLSNKDLSNMMGGSGCSMEGANCSWGFIRNTSYEYMWAISNGTNGTCNNTNAEFGLEDDVDNGTAASRTPTTSGITRNAGDLSFSYFSVTRAGHLLEGSCVAVSTACDKVYIYKYDRRSQTGVRDFQQCTNARWVQQENLPPNDVHTLTLNAYAPCGIPDGDLATGIIYVVAEN